MVVALWKMAAVNVKMVSPAIFVNTRVGFTNFLNSNFVYFLAHCEQDEDCENRGKCVTESSSLIVKSCYCAYGYFGQNCRQSKWKKDGKWARTVFE